MQVCLETYLLRKGHVEICKLHDYIVKEGWECESCARDRLRAAQAERANILEARDAERKRLEKDNDFMNQKAKERKPRVGTSGESAVHIEVDLKRKY